MSIRELTAPDLTKQPSCIVVPEDEATSRIGIKGVLLHHLPTFCGLSTEDANKHIMGIHMVCNNMKPLRVDLDTLFLKVFPRSPKSAVTEPGKKSVGDLGLISYDDEKKKLREQEKGNNVQSTDLMLRSTEMQYEGIKECQHYTSMQKILLVGEGDLSFAACLANAFGNAANMVVTTLDSEVQLIRKYGNAKANLQVLKEKGCTILHLVGAHTMSNHADLLRNQPFDMIVFNFPHAGIPLYSETNPYLIERHQALLRGFFENAYDLLSKRGEIHVTHKTAYPFDTWNITELAEEAGLKLVDEVCFNLGTVTRKEKDMEVDVTILSQSEHAPHSCFGSIDSSTPSFTI